MPAVNNVTGEDRRAERLAMVAQQLEARGLGDRRVLAALSTVPRHRFVPESQTAFAYADEPLPIGQGQTISQPYIVALMTQLLAPGPTDRVLEIGTGCGYQTAVLAALAGEVCTVEIVPELAARARATLERLGVANVACRTGNGRVGWVERAPFAGIIVTAAPLAPAPAWWWQLGLGGRLVVPLGGRHEQWLHRFTKRERGWDDEVILPVRFVPLVDAPPAGDAAPWSPRGG